MFTQVSAFFICQILFRDWGNPTKVLYLFVTKCDLLSLVTVAKLFCSYSSALSSNTHSLIFFIQNAIHKHVIAQSHIFATMNLYVYLFLSFFCEYLKAWRNACNISTQQLATLLGTTFCIRLAPLLHVRSIIEDFFRSLHTSYRVKLVCECQSLRRDNATDFNYKVGLLTQ